MKRATGSQLSGPFDLVIIGGGINGAACAWEATLRGLSTLLVDRGDFGAATSSQSARIAHSGLRYLQHADIRRLRESVRERCTLSRIAPHLVRNQPFLMPVYGHGIKGRETMSIYMKLYDWLSPERRQFADASRRVPDSRVLSPAAGSELWRDLDTRGLSGLALWYEGQMHDTERILVSFLRSAADRGLTLANYMEAYELLREGNRVCGVRLRDRVQGGEHEVRTRFVLNATGPWLAKNLLGLCPGARTDVMHASKAFSLIIPSLGQEHALSFSIPPMYTDRNAVIDKGGSIQFAIPWRDRTMIGSLHLACGEDPDAVSVSEEEIERYIELINQGYPSLNLKRSDVEHVLWGVIPSDGPGSAAPLKHYRILDHESRDGVASLLSVLGVKFTTARDVAQATISLVARKLGVSLRDSESSTTPLWGGDFESLESLESTAVQAAPGGVPRSVVRRLVETYGSRYVDVLAYASRTSDGVRTIADTDLLVGEIRHAVHEEMAASLSDVLLRRTSVGSHRRPSLKAIDDCADVLTSELAWDESRRSAEVERLLKRYADLPIS